jgi:hypothetical protein
MRTRFVKAKFQGCDNSLGFKNNQEYTLTVRHQGGLNILIETEDGKRCEYQSIISFMDNWNNIQVLGESNQQKYQGYGAGRGDFR